MVSHFIRIITDGFSVPKTKLTIASMAPASQDLTRSHKISQDLTRFQCNRASTGKLAILSLHRLPPMSKGGRRRLNPSLMHINLKTTSGLQIVSKARDDRARLDRYKFDIDRIDNFDRENFDSVRLP